MPQEYLIKCPHCQSQNVEPKGATWWCNNCNKPFDLAMVQHITDAPDQPATKKRGKK